MLTSAIIRRFILGGAFWRYSGRLMPWRPLRSWKIRRWEIVSQVSEAYLGLGALEPDGADEQAMRSFCWAKIMFDMRTDH